MSFCEQEVRLQTLAGRARALEYSSLHRVAPWLGSRADANHGGELRKTSDNRGSLKGPCGGRHARGTFPRRIPLRNELYIGTPCRGELAELTAALVSAVIAHVMKRLGGIWFVSALLLSFLPRGLRDFGYEAVASLRRTMVGVATETCPLVPPDLSARLRD